MIKSDQIMLCYQGGNRVQFKKVSNLNFPINLYFFVNDSE